MNHWEISKLEEVTEKVGSGATPRGGFNSYKLSGIPLIRSMNVHFDGLRLEGIAYLDDKQADELKNVEVKADDVLLNITGASIGRVTQAPKELDGARVNQHVCIIRPIPVLDPKFLCKYLSSPSIQAMIMDKEYGGTRQALTKQMILEFDIPIPPVNEQRRIVAKIEALKARSQRVKEELEAISALLDQFRQSVLAAAFRGELTADWREKNPDVEPASVLLERIRAERRRRWEEAELEKMKAQEKTPKDDKWKEKYKEPISVDVDELPSLPNKWHWATLDEIMKKIVDGTHHTPTYIENGVAFLSVKDIKNGKIYFDNCKYISQEEHKQLWERCHPEVGDLLITKSGTIGRCAVVETERPFSLFVSVALLKPATHEVITSFISLAFQSWFQTINVQNDVTGSAIKNFHLIDFRKLALPIPPIEEQHQILKQVEALMNKAGLIQALIDTLHPQTDELNQSILAKAFRGELVPQDPNDEPASVLLERIRAEREKLDTKKKAKGKTEKKSRKAKPEPAEPKQLSFPGFE